MPPLLADFIHARAYKPICAKLLTLPREELQAEIEDGQKKIRQFENRERNQKESGQAL